MNGKIVGFYKYEAPDMMPPTYHFSLTKSGEIVFSRMFKHLFKAELPKFLEGLSKLRDERA